MRPVGTPRLQDEGKPSQWHVWHSCTQHQDVERVYKAWSGSKKMCDSHKHNSDQKSGTISEWQAMGEPGHFSQLAIIIHHVLNMWLLRLTYCVEHEA